jgi:hypothetical protein
MPLGCSSFPAVIRAWVTGLQLVSLSLHGTFVPPCVGSVIADGSVTGLQLVSLSLHGYHFRCNLSPRIDILTLFDVKMICHQG